MTAGGARPRRKGDRIEREIVDAHREIGVKAERYPLSGASRFRGSGHDIDVYAFGRDEAPIVGEIKARKKGNGFKQLEAWLQDYDLLFLRRNNSGPLVVLPWDTYARLIGGKLWREASPKRSEQPAAATSARPDGGGGNGAEA